MVQTKKRLLCFMAALTVALSVVPHVAFGEGGDSWHSDQQEADVISVDESTEDAVDAATLDDVDAAVSSAEGSFEEENPSLHMAFYGDEDAWYNNGATADNSEDWLLGVDVSEWNGYIDWEAVSEGGVSYAIIKCGGSDDYEGCYADSQLVANAKECERLGIPYGVYFFSTAVTGEQAAVEAEFVVKTLQEAELNPCLPVYIDLELAQLGDFDSIDVLKDISTAFCTIVGDAGYKPGIYASVSWWEYLMTDECYDQWAKWVASYDGYCSYGDAQCWQCSFDGQINGIDWPVDLDVWFI